MSQTEYGPSAGHTVIYDVVHTNVGRHYNPQTGVFTVPTHGVYVFTWNVYMYGSEHANTEIMVNANAVCGSYAGPSGYLITSPATVVLGLNQGDEVHIRTSEHLPLTGDLHSTPAYRSTFSGWKLF
jgi:hypothetical protein